MKHSLIQLWLISLLASLPLCSLAESIGPEKLSPEILVDRQERVFEHFFRFHGSSSYDKYEEFLSTSEDPLVRQATELLKNNQLEVIMARKEETRLGIMSGGFKNLHQTGTSSGVQHIGARNNVESAMLYMSVDEYKALDDTLKPKYGSIQLPENFAVDSPLTIAKYGTDLYVFKEEVKKRTTFFPGDSLDHLTKLARNEGVNLFFERFGPSRLEMTFLPWSRKLWMVPFMLLSLREGRFDAPAYYFTNEGFRVPIQWTESHHPYWETQTFGELTLDDVERFEFRRNPPSGIFLDALKKRDIAIIDRRERP